MHLIPLNSIVIDPARQRREFDPAKLQELLVSLTETPYGLQHPIVVRQFRGVTVLVAGERRLRAVKDAFALGLQIRHSGCTIPLGQIPVVDLGELDPIDAFEAELEENIRRTDLTLIERAKATARLFDLRNQQAKAAGRPEITPTDLAKEVYDIPDSKPRGKYGSYTGTIKNHLIIAEHANNPDVRKATSIKEAITAIKKAETREKNLILAKALGKTFTSRQHSLYHDDCLSVLADIPAETFQIILTDPPYGIGADTFGRYSQAKEHFYRDTPEEWERLMEHLPLELFRVATADAHAYIFCAFQKFSSLRNKMLAVGWRVHETPLIWHNPAGFRVPWPEQGFQRKYEIILYAIKGSKKVTSITGDVIECHKDPSLDHPAQKPVALLENLLRRSAEPGDRVLDPFVGSGSTLVAADNLKLLCTAIELDSAAYSTAAKRLQDLIDGKDQL